MDIEIKPSEKASDSIVSFAQRLLGPVAEAADFLSDKIRFMRWKSAQRTLELAEEIAFDRGIEIKEVPVKFLVPFLEKCSLEEENSELVKKWAELLATAISEYDNKLISYADILAQLGPGEVKLLEEMWDKTDPMKMGNALHMAAMYGRFDSSNKLLDFHNFKTEPNSEVDSDGRSIMCGVIAVRKEGEENFLMQTGSYLHDYKEFTLERLGLVRVMADQTRLDEDHDSFILKSQLTPLGYHFVKACRGVTVKP